MGLDMYLHKKTYVKRWEHNGDDNYDITVVKKGKIVDTIKPDRIAYIIEEVGYWRKFNALHQWFVDNCQDGKDDCGEYYVSKKKLQELLEILNQIKDGSITKAEELLPTSSGFFFGGTEYDEWYFAKVNDTVVLLTELLQEDNNGDFYYQSSW